MVKLIRLIMSALIRGKTKREVKKIIGKKLMKMMYYDAKSEVRLETYADTVVVEKEGFTSYIAAIRFGGYAEGVKGMADAIYGGGQISIMLDGKRKCLYSRVKQYRREYSHDGIYCEATLMIKDDEQVSATNDDGTDGKTAGSKPRKCYLFCEQDDSDRLFEELDKKSAVPLIPEFKDYVLSELTNKGILKKLEVITYHEKFDVWLLTISADEKNIIDVINNGLKSGAISIPGADGSEFPGIHSVTQYLNKFGVMIAENIQNRFQPVFDPATETLSPEILAVNANIMKKTGYTLYDAQLAVAEAHKRCLDRKKATLCISECGSGKTKIGVTALHAHQQRKPGKYFNVVMCPSHMTKKWVREIEESLPDTFAVVITSIKEFKEAYAAFAKNNNTCYAIMSKEKARDGYMKRPAAIWNKRRKGFICPDCHGTIEMELTDDGSKYRVPADALFFKRENKQNHKCGHCGSLLWTALRSESQSEWVKVTDFGFVHRRMASGYLEGVKKKPSVYGAVMEIAGNPDGNYPNAGAYRRFPLSTYIKYQMRGRIDGLIIDELHNFNNNSGQGDAMGELFQVAKKVIGMTATIINGYSSGIFHLLYRISPDLMLKDGKHYEKPIEFNSEYGVTESTFEISGADYNSNRRTAKRKVRERQLPGVSPLVYSRFLMDKAAFLSLNDMGKDLPEFEEYPIPLIMNEDVAHEYNRLERNFKDVLRANKDIARKVLSAYLGLLTVYPDQPYGHKPVIHPLTLEDLVVPNDTSSFNELHEKDYSVLDVVQRKIAEGGRVLIYTSWVRIDSQDKLSNLLTEHGYRVSVLTASVPPNKREGWVAKQVENGIQVLITNPSLVETGLDMNDFTTLYYYNISYNLFTLRQSSRRSWRINQKAPRIEVYFAYYEGTMQHRAIRLMATKMAVAGIIEGSNFTDEGLAAMSECADMATALARELTQGIKDEVEDLGAVFKKMAVLKPVATQTLADLAGNDDLPVAGYAFSDTASIEINNVFSEATSSTISNAIADIVYDIPAYISDDMFDSNIFTIGVHMPHTGILSIVDSTRAVKATRSIATFTDESQISMFTLYEEAIAA